MKPPQSHFIIQSSPPPTHCPSPTQATLPLYPGGPRKHNLADLCPSSKDHPWLGWFSCDGREHQEFAGAFGQEGRRGGQSSLSPATKSLTKSEAGTGNAEPRRRER